MGMFAAKAPMNPELVRRKARMLSGLRPALWTTNMFVVLTTAAVLWPLFPAQQLILWTLLHIALALARLLDWRRFERQPPHDPVVLERWLQRLVSFAVIGGVLWGLAAVWFLDIRSTATFTFLAIVLIWVATASLSGLAVYFPSFIAFITPLLGMLAFSLLEAGGAQSVGMSAGTVAYYVMLLMFGRNYARTIEASIVTDLENARLLALAERANREKSTFLAAVSHDVRQPLYSLGLFLAALKPQLTTPRQLELFQQAATAELAIEEMFDTLLEISRFDTGTVIAVPVHARLADIIAPIVGEFRALAEARGLQLSANDADAVVITDPVLFGRVLRNLVSNAIKYTDRGSVEIRCDPATPGSLAVSVVDSGRGIAESEHEKIFSEYYQLDNPERDRNKGLGLGLAIVRRTLALLDHGITLTSAPGAGSCFSVVLPQGDPELVARVDDATETAPSRQARILVIDDERGIRTGMATLLEDRGLEVVTAASAAEAIANLTPAVLPDLLICDYRLRENLSGFDAIDAVRAATRGDLPAFIITGDTDPQIREQARQRGLYLLGKPVRPAQLLHVITRLLEPS